MSGLIAELNSLSEAPHRWRSVKREGLDGVFFARYEHDFVFFRTLSDVSLGVVSILHEATDLPDRLREDLSLGEA